MSNKLPLLHLCRCHTDFHFLNLNIYPRPFQQNTTKQVCVQLPTLGVNVTLLAFAAERRAAAPLLLSADRAAIDRYILPPGTQQQTCSSGMRLANYGTDGQTDSRPLHRSCSALYTNSSAGTCVCALLYLLNNGSCYSNGSVSPHRRRHTD